MKAPAGGRLELVTPEQVPVTFALASVSERIIALLVDLVAIAVALLGLFLVAGLGRSEEYVTAIVILGLFLLLNFYFAGAELLWHGRTLGKRAVGLRVVARDGGPLTGGMILARNLTRDLELYLPLVALVAPRTIVEDAPAPVRWGGVVWLFVIALLPLFNRRRARLGDIVAGTVVVAVPRAVLLHDLVREVSQRAAEELTFTPQQLDIYGIEELHVLERVLRQPDPNPALLADIAERIKRKIGWDPQRWHVLPSPFLKAFYAAQRQRLEHKMLLGKRQERKTR